MSNYKSPQAQEKLRLLKEIKSRRLIRANISDWRNTPSNLRQEIIDELSENHYRQNGSASALGKAYLSAIDILEGITKLEELSFLEKVDRDIEWLISELEKHLK